jgi:signal transduction histidine kinase
MGIGIYWLSTSLIILLPGIYLVYLGRKRFKLLKNIERTRYHIARDLHDDIGATLSSISFYTQAIKQQVNSSNTGNALEILDRVGALSREMMDNMSDIVWMVNPENDSSEKFFEKIEEHGTNLFAAKNITFLFYADPNVLSVTFDMDKRKDFFLVCKEAMNNAVKYAECSTFELLINKAGNQIVTVMKDNGKGFDQEQTKPGNGLLNMKVRVANLGGKLQVHSSAGGGTAFSFEFAVPPKW